MTGRELYTARKPRHRRTWSIAAIILLIVFVIVGQIGTVIPAMVAGWFTEANSSQWPQLTFILIAAFGASAVILCLWIWFFERRSLATIGLNGNGFARFARGYLIGLASLITVVGLIYALGGYQIEGAGSLAPAALIPVGALFIGFIIQGSTEEIFFRGWLMQLLASRHGLILAVIVNSLLFGLFHGLNIEPGRELFLGLANIVLFGLFMSLYAAREGSIWGVCGWHAAWNWLLASGFGLEVSGQQVPITPMITDLAFAPDVAWWITGGIFGPEASVITTGVLAAGTLFILARGKWAKFEVEVAADEAGGTQADTVS